MISRLGRLALLGVALIAGLSLLMILSYTIPDNLIRRHVGTSVWQLERESASTSLLGLVSLTQDDFTDGIMLNESLRQEGVGPVQSAFGNYMTRVASPSGGFLSLESLKAAVAGRGEGMNYARYWHGYQVVLRPLLLFFDLRALRWVNAAAFSLLVLVVTALLRYRLSLGSAIAFLLSLLAVGFSAVPMSLQYSGVFYVALLGMATVLYRVREEGVLPHDIETFFVIGALTSYVDLLTAPVLTFGMPLAVLVLSRMRSPSESALNRQLSCTVKNSCAWAAGYVGCWSAKWVISSLVLRTNVLLDAANNVALRINGADQGVRYGHMDTLMHNVARLFPLFGDVQPQGVDLFVVAAACAVPATAGILGLILLVSHLRSDAAGWRVLALLPVASLPFAWYLVVNNHSREHFIYTFRGLAVTVFTVVASLFYLFDPDYLRGLKTKLVAHLRQSPPG